MRRTTIFLVALFCTIGALGAALLADAATPADFGLREGDMVSASGSNDPDIYIINVHGYKRLFLNPVIFNFYGHLGGWGNVKNVSPSTRDAFPTTTLFQNCETSDPKVYAVEVTGEDTGTVHHVNVSGDAAVQQDPNFFKKVFCINNTEYSWYTHSSVQYTHTSQIPPYHRAGTCQPRPACLDAQPACQMPEPAEGWCPPTPTPTPATPTPTPSPSIVLSGTGGGTGSTITFTANLQDVPACFSHTWFYGDNMSETTQYTCYTANPAYSTTLTKQHTYNGNGTYSASLNVGNTSSNTVVVTISGGTPTPVPTPQTWQVNMVGFNFSPGTLNVKRGDTVRFTNLESAVHSAVHDGASPQWSTPALSQGQSSDVNTSSLVPGTYRYHCGIHGQAMVGTVFVNP